MDSRQHNGNSGLDSVYPISKHISYREATRSLTAERHEVGNEPDGNQLYNMRELAKNVFEPMREGLGGKPISIASFFRCQELNSLVGGSIRSQHMAIKGAAMDIDNDNRGGSPTNREIFFYIYENLEFDQLIWEFGDDQNPAWVHVSFNKGKNRRQSLKARHNNVRTYIEFKP